MNYRKSMKISLIHPSRGRAQKAIETWLYWLQNAYGKLPFEHILSLDSDDGQLEEYIKLFNNSKIVIGDNTNVVEATNRAAKIATGDILIYLSDDFKCPKYWDEALNTRFHTSNDVPIDSPLLIKVDDCLQKFYVKVLTIPIMNKELYKVLGYFWHPGYKSMFVDEDLFWTCANNDWMALCEDLKFPHEHCSIGKAERDETYKRSELNWNQGKELFAQRKLENFPL